MSQDEVNLLEQADAYRWVPLSALKAGEYLSCIDGRHADCIIAAPGGDIGEFILLMGCIESVRGHAFSEDEVGVCLGEVMEWHSRFYMHTDEACLRALSVALQKDARFNEVMGLDNLQRVTNLLRHPRRELRAPLAEYLVDPQYIGCGHLNTMMRYPDRYGLRRQLVRDAITGFYRRMWNGSPSPNYAVVYGEHAEDTLIIIDTEDEARSSTFVPSVVCGVLEGSDSAFIVHEAARRYLMAESLDLLLGSGAIDAAVDVEAIRRLAKERSALALSVTMDALAPGMPTLHAVFDGKDHTVRWSQS